MTKFLISAVISASVFFSFVVLLQIFPQFKQGETTRDIVILITIVSFVVSMSKVKNRDGTQLASDVFNAVKETKDNIQASIDSKSTDFYAIAEEEYENGEIDKGSWSQALVKAKGDESLRKVEYMKLRVMQLKRKS